MLFVFLVQDLGPLPCGTPPLPFRPEHRDESVVMISPPFYECQMMIDCVGPVERDDTSVPRQKNGDPLSLLSPGRLPGWLKMARRATSGTAGLCAAGGLPALSLSLGPYCQQFGSRESLGRNTQGYCKGESLFPPIPMGKTAREEAKSSFPLGKQPQI